MAEFQGIKEGTDSVTNVELQVSFHRIQMASESEKYTPFHWRTLTDKLEKYLTYHQKNVL